MTTRLRLGAVLFLALGIWACGGDTMSMIGDAMVDAGGAMQDSGTAQAMTFDLSCSPHRRRIDTGTSYTEVSKYWAEGTAGLDVAGAQRVRAYVCGYVAAGPGPFSTDPSCPSGSTCTGTIDSGPVDCAERLVEFEGTAFRVDCGTVTVTNAVSVGFHYTTARVIIE